MQEQDAARQAAIAAYEVERKQLMRIFAANFKELRQQLGLSQEELADKTNLHRTNIGSYEQADHEPTLSTMLILADAFDVSLDRLAEGMPVPKERRPRRNLKKTRS